MDRPAGIANRPRAAQEMGALSHDLLRPPSATWPDRERMPGMPRHYPRRTRAEGGTVYLKKTCPEHGTTSTPVWRGLSSYLRWGQAPRSFSQPPVCATEVKRGCPHDCGLCPDHLQQSCCVLLEVPPVEERPEQQKSEEQKFNNWQRQRPAPAPRPAEKSSPPPHEEKSHK